MNFIAEIDVMPRPELLDPQGKAVTLGLANLGIAQVTDVRIGRHITIQLQATTEKEAYDLVEKACKSLLANAIMENYIFTLKSLA
jgi:phosphoribosylformylglycinamidine synthase subunit PurS